MSAAIRHRTIIIILAAALVLSLLISTAVGSVELSPTEILRAIFVNDDSTARLLVFELRLPRAFTGALVGVCLSLAGVILQGIMGNRLASPSTVGVTSGASLAGYLTLVAFPKLSALLPLGAIVGAFGATMLICALSYRRGLDSVRLILSGMAVSALFGAFNDIIRTFFADRLANASGYLVGGLNGCSWNSLLMILPYASLGILVCIFLPDKLNLLALGDETARSLGVRVEAVRFLLIVTSSLLSGAAIASAGMISFVGLIVPHIARLLVGSDHRKLLSATILLGATLVMLCDTIGRVILQPGELPVSIILSLIGSPFFLWLLARS